MKSTMRKTKATKKKKKLATAAAAATGAAEEENITAPEKINNEDGPEVVVSKFDYSVENHLRAVDTISRLCEETANDDIGESDIERLSSMITFLRSVLLSTYYFVIFAAMFFFFVFVCH